MPRKLPLFSENRLLYSNLEAREPAYETPQELVRQRLQTRVAQRVKPIWHFVLQCHGCRRERSRKPTNLRSGPESLYHAFGALEASRSANILHMGWHKPASWLAT